MVKNFVKRISIGAATTAVACMGMAGAASAHAFSFSTEGPNSPVWANLSNYMSSSYKNNNSIYGSNSNNQNAKSGNAYVGGNGGGAYSVLCGWRSGNTHVGDVSTGNAYNNNVTNFVADVMNEVGVGNMGSGGAGGGVWVSTEGPNSPIHAHLNNNVSSTVNNTNNVNLRNSNYQTASTGSAYVSGNTWVGSVSTGNASNSNNTQADVQIMNDTPSMASTAMPSGSFSASTEGPNSGVTAVLSNVVRNSVTNTNNVSFSNTNSQTATSGSAYVSGNTSVGNVMTGDATNHNSTNVAVTLTNN